jgi:hypothetical protein
LKGGRPASAALDKMKRRSCHGENDEDDHQQCENVIAFANATEDRRGRRERSFLHGLSARVPRAARLFSCIRCRLVSWR